MKTTYRIVNGTPILVQRALGDAFRALRAQHPGTSRKTLKGMARRHREFHAYPAPAWATFVQA